MLDELILCAELSPRVAAEKMAAAEVLREARQEHQQCLDRLKRRDD